MSQAEGAFNLINQDASNKLNFYNKVIPNLPHSLNDLIEKAKNVESKLDTNKNGANEAGIENSDLNKYTNLKEKQKRDTKFFEFDNFRRVNNYIPKIHINKHKEIEGESTPLPFYSEQDENYKGIMSLYGDKEIFEPIPNNFFINQENYKIPVKKGEENLKMKNDIDYDYTLPPNFYTNRYVEYVYEDRGDKLYEENSELKNLFGKNPNKDNKNEFNFINNNSPYLKAYNDLLEKEKEELENENKEIYQNEILRGQEFTLSRAEQENISNFVKINKENHKEKSPLDNYFEMMLAKRRDNNYIYEEEASNDKSSDNGEDNKNNDKKDKTQYGPNDISFEIKIQGEITKKIRKSKKKAHPRGIKLKGPIAKWYRQNEDYMLEKQKGYFDIRKIDFKEDEKPKSLLEEQISDKNSSIKEEDDDCEEDFRVKDVFEKGKLNKKDTIFTSRKIKEFGEKTFKYIFHQLQKYYLELITNITKASYNVLKFLSDTQATNLELVQENHKGLIDYIYWHPKLLELTIPSSFLQKLSEVMKTSDWDCQLTTLSIKKSNSPDNTAEKDLNTIFALPSSLTIQNIHFIDMNFKKGFFEALFTHIDTFYKVNIPVTDNKSCKISSQLFEFLKTNKLPILNLSWKRTPNSDMNIKSENGVNIKGIYYILMYMLIKALKNNVGTIPEIFNKLDLSESTIDGSVNYLVKIITKFKIIKELDISNTRLSNDQRIIDSNAFWSKIKLTKSYASTFDQKKFFDETMDNIIDKITEFRKEKEKGEENSNLNSNSDEDTSYDYSMGILPLLEKIYLYNNESKINVSDEVYSLFRKLKFFRGIYYSAEANTRVNQENINNNNFCDALVEKINNDKKTFCENVFIFSND